MSLSLDARHGSPLPKHDTAALLLEGGSLPGGPLDLRRAQPPCLDSCRSPPPGGSRRLCLPLPPLIGLCFSSKIQLRVTFSREPFLMLAPMDSIPLYPMYCGAASVFREALGDWPAREEPASANFFFPYSLYNDWQTSNGVPAPRNHLTFANSTRFSLSLSLSHTHVHTHSVCKFKWSSLPCPPFHTMSLGSTGGFCLFSWGGLGFRGSPTLKRQCDLMTRLLS